MMIRCDFHIHSSLSPDSRQTVAEIVRAAAEARLDLIGICDHNALHDPSELPDDAGVRVLFGTEFSTDIGHIVGYFIDRSVFARLDVTHLPLLAGDVLDAIADCGGLAILAHPFSPVDHGFAPYLERFDAVELYNCAAAWSGRRDCNELAIRYFAGRDVAGLAASDSHCRDEIGHAATVLDLSGELTAASLRSALASARLYGRPLFPHQKARSGFVRLRKQGGTLKRRVKLCLKTVYGHMIERRVRRGRLVLRELKGETVHDLLRVGPGPQ